MLSFRRKYLYAVVFCLIGNLILSLNWGGFLSLHKSVSSRIKLLKFFKRALLSIAAFSLTLSFFPVKYCDRRPDKLRFYISIMPDLKQKGRRVKNLQFKFDNNFVKTIWIQRWIHSLASIIRFAWDVKIRYLKRSYLKY